MKSRFEVIKKLWPLPKEYLIERSLKNLSVTEKVIFFCLIFIFIFSSLFLLLKVNASTIVEIPSKGGSLVEGVIGTPRFINPLFSSDGSDADKDLTLLVYSGLLKATPDGELRNDLSENFEISPDGLSYTFRLRDDIYFHDGAKITTEDIEFTIQKIQDSSVRSPKRTNWENVSIEVLDSREIKFILSQPFSYFLDNTTLGILPKHLWSEVSPEQFISSSLNIEPIGSGPYKIKSIKRDSNGLPTEYRLESFKKYALGEPHIKKLKIKFFQNEMDMVSAFEKKQIEAINSINPLTVKELEILKNRKLESVTLSRIFGLFLNQNQASLFTNKELRRALNTALDKEEIIEEVLLGHGEVSNSPLPTFFSKVEKDPYQSREERISAAKEILKDGGWEFNEEEKIWKKETKSEDWILSFSISTADTADLKSVAEILKRQWEELGVVVDIRVFELSDLKQNVIRPRKYDSLLFGKVIGRDVDLSPFWHSSQRNDPGLNVSLYTNINVDKILEEIRLESDRTIKMEKYLELEEEILMDYPAIFLYSPNFIYFVPEELKNLKINFITTPSERFLNVHEWYIETDKIWKFFLI